MKKLWAVLAIVLCGCSSMIPTTKTLHKQGPDAVLESTLDARKVAGCVYDRFSDEGYSMKLLPLPNGYTLPVIALFPPPARTFVVVDVLDRAGGSEIRYYESSFYPIGAFFLKDVRICGGADAVETGG